MAKFSGTSTRTNVRSHVRTTTSALTYEQGPGYARDAKSELFLLAIANMVREHTFYESADERDRRFVQLIHQVTQEDPDWVQRFIPYLRNTMLMRSASVVMAAEYVAAGGPNGRAAVRSALARGDEPAELLAYWMGEHGRRIPVPIKRGVADAVKHLYTEFAALRYDGGTRGFRMGDVIELTHPKPRDEHQSALFRYLLDRRHHPDQFTISMDRLPVIYGVLEWVDAGAPISRVPVGMTWERLSSYTKMDKDAWEAVIPQMRYMALLRNLRNFDQVGIDDDVAAKVMQALADPTQVALSRQFPIRFYSAYKHAAIRWHQTLSEALQHSLANVPALSGRSLIMVDMSGSMFFNHSRRSKIEYWELAALFGAALALRAEACDLYGYSSDAHRVSDFNRSTSVLQMMEKIKGWSGVGQGTRTLDLVRALYDGHDRVIVLTDEQTFAPTYGASVEVLDGMLGHIPLMYTFNLAGYRVGHQPSGEKGRFTFGGLTDAGFRAIDLLEQGRDTDWPF